MQKAEQSRGTWGSKAGFVLAAAGSAIGLGNIWRFPYITGLNGGAAFVVLYLFFVVLIGLPILIAELTIGRSTKRNPIGAFKALTILQKYTWISTAIRWSAAAVAFIIGLLSFKDAYVYKKTGKTSDIALQLPKAVKMRIHGIISGNLSGSSLVIGAVITGFLVTLLEAICTGQMYIPYIVAMTQNSSLRVAGYLYLIFYNFLFVLPLLIVMVLAYFGLKWNDLAKQTQKRMVLLKVLLGLIMTGLAVYLAVGSGFIS